MKELIRQIGFDDGFFRKSDERVPLVGCVVRGNDLVEGFIISSVSVDGDDATELLAELIDKSKFKDTLKVVFLKGVTLGGFNVVDIKALSDSVNMPVIVLLRKPPDMRRIKDAIKNVDNYEDKLRRMERAGRIFEIKRDRGRLFFQKAGVNKKDAIAIIEKCIKTGNIPESVRIAHMVASAMTLGESVRRA